MLILPGDSLDPFINLSRPDVVGFQPLTLDPTDDGRHQEATRPGSRENIWVLNQKIGVKTPKMDDL